MPCPTNYRRCSPVVLLAAVITLRPPSALADEDWSYALRPAGMAGVGTALFRDLAPFDLEHIRFSALTPAAREGSRLDAGLAYGAGTWRSVVRYPAGSGALVDEQRGSSTNGGGTLSWRRNVEESSFAHLVRIRAATAVERTELHRRTEGALPPWSASGNLCQLGDVEAGLLVAGTWKARSGLLHGASIEATSRRESTDASGFEVQWDTHAIQTSFGFALPIADALVASQVGIVADNDWSGWSIHPSARLGAAYASERVQLGAALAGRSHSTMLYSDASDRSFSGSVAGRIRTAAEGEPAFTAGIDALASQRRAWASTSRLDAVAGIGYERPKFALGLEGRARFVRIRPHSPISVYYLPDPYSNARTAEVAMGGEAGPLRGFRIRAGIVTGLSLRSPPTRFSDGCGPLTELPEPGVFGTAGLAWDGSSLRIESAFRVGRTSRADNGPYDHDTTWKIETTSASGSLLLTKFW